MAAAGGKVTLRVRLLAVVVVLNLVAAALTGTIVVLIGRAAAGDETEASMRFAGDYVNEAVRAMQDSPPSLILRTLQTQFVSLHHVRVEVMPLQGSASTANQRKPSSRDTAPRWFSNLVGSSIPVQSVPLLVHNRLIGNVRLVADPQDEIGEAWQYAQAILLAGAVLNALVLGLFFVALGRLLRPLTALIRGLADLEARNYAVRLQKPSLPDLAVIADHFNRAASTVGREQDANRALNRKLVTAQDNERRRTALDLHDEVGPCLFALDTCTSSIAAAPYTIDRAELAKSAEEATSLVRELKAINRRVLGRLRPASLGRIALEECLGNLVRELGASCKADLKASIGPLAETYGPTVDLTVYRSIQEGVFNAVRHARARSIEVVARECESAPSRSLIMRVSDDGRGSTQRAGVGLGLAGLQERVEALAGRFEFVASARGARLSITLPLQEEPATAGTGVGAS